MPAIRFNDQILITAQQNLPTEIQLPSNPGTGFAYVGSVFADYQPPWQPGSAFTSAQVLPYAAAAGYFFTVYVNGACIGTFTETAMLSNVLLNAGETLSVVVAGNNNEATTPLTLRYVGYVITQDQIPIPAPLPFTAPTTQMTIQTNPGIGAYGAESNVLAGTVNATATQQTLDVLVPAPPVSDVSLTHIQLQSSVYNSTTSEVRYDTQFLDAIPPSQGGGTNVLMRNELVTFTGTNNQVLQLGPLIQPLPMNGGTLQLLVPAAPTGLIISVSYLVVFMYTNPQSGMVVTNFS